MQSQTLVLRSAASRENDRLITALTKEFGVVRAFANGARKPKSPLHAATQPFGYGRMEFTQRRDTYTVKEALTEGVFFDGLAADISRLALANYCAAICAELAPQQEDASEHMRLMLNALHFLCEGTRPQLLIKSVTELRLLCLAGYAPDLDAPESNAAPENGTLWFDCANGVVVTRAANHCAPVSPAILAAMQYICAAPLERAFRFHLPEESLLALSRLSQAYVRQQAGRRFAELDYWEKL